MPTVLKSKSFRFFFFSLEGNEPPHVHVEDGSKVAKFWLDPINLASSYGFRNHELTKLRQIVFEHKKDFLERWYEHFSS